LALSMSLVTFAPTIWSFTSPFLKNNRSGMDFTLYFTARLRATSTLTLVIFAWPSISPESWSRTGPIILQGPHHSAQKSTSTGRSESITSDWKLSSVRLSAMRRTWNPINHSSRSRSKNWSGIRNICAHPNEISQAGSGQGVENTKNHILYKV